MNGGGIPVVLAHCMLSFYSVSCLGVIERALSDWIMALETFTGKLQVEWLPSACHKEIASEGMKALLQTESKLVGVGK